MEEGLLTVIIPTMNEPLIKSLVDEVHKALYFLNHEIVVVDKSEKTPVLSSATVVRQHSKGLGRAIVEGLQVAKGEWFAVMDGDFSHRPEDLATMVRRMPDYDFLLGSRYSREGKNLDVPMRRVASRVFNKLARLILNLKFQDPMSGLIVARAAVFQKVQPNPIGFKINLEIVYRATRLGFRGTESPIIFKPRKIGKSKAGVREAVRTMSYILALKLRE